MKLVFILMAFFISSALSAEPPKLLLAKTWDESIDPTGWWISEKYDGVRGFWDGDTMRTRGGKTVYLPDYFYLMLADLTGK